VRVVGGENEIDEETKRYIDESFKKLVIDIQRVFNIVTRDVRIIQTDISAIKKDIEKLTQD